MQENPISMEWKFSEKLFFRFIFIYVLIFIHSFSFPHHFIPDLGKFTEPFFESIVKFSAKYVFQIHHAYYPQLVSDSTGFYIHAFNLIFISIFISAIWGFIDRRRMNYVRLQYWFFVMIRYYLALQLFEYGFSKFFKWQFYFPEPNTLFKTIGNTPKDLLYWSSMGTSRLYSMFTGGMEILAAALLLFRRSFLFGAIVALGIMVNVLMINLGFDISVKLYSGFLLLLCVILIYPSAKKLFGFFFSDKTVSNEKQSPDFLMAKHRKFYLIVKILVVGMILGDTLSLYFKTGNFNDDEYPRPFMHGAYEVKMFVRNSDTISKSDPARWKMVFIHRRGYFITQDMNDEMEDYVLNIDEFGNKLVIQSPDGTVKTFFTYSKTGQDDYSLTGKLKGDSLTVHLKKIDLSKLPLNDEDFHWTIDE